MDEAEPGDVVEMLRSRTPWLKLVQEDSGDKVSGLEEKLGGVVRMLLSVIDENMAMDDFRLACAAGSYTKGSPSWDGPSCELPLGGRVNTQLITISASEVYSAGCSDLSATARGGRG